MSILIPQNNQTVSDYFEAKRARILLKTTMDKMDSMISNPTELELDASILDAINFINLTKPISNLNAIQAVSLAANDPAYDHLVLIGACYYILQTKWSEWAHSGDQIQLSILSEPDRMDRFEVLMNSFKDELDKLAPDYKVSGSTRVSKANFISTSKSINYGKGTGLTRRGYKSAYRSS